MALLGLDEIEWDKLSHAYGSAKDIPDLLRALDEAETDEEFDKIHTEIVIRVNHQSDIYDSTAYTVKFFLQILQNVTETARRFTLLYHFGNLLQHIQHFPIGFFKNSADCRVVLFRNNIAAYDAISTGLSYYLEGIRDKDDNLRLANLRILFALNEQREEILPNLIECIDTVNDEWIQACIVWTYASIAMYDKYGHKRSIYHQQLSIWLEHKNALVRYAAAFAKLRIYMAAVTERSELTIKTLAEALTKDIWSSKGKVYGDKLDIYLELTPFRNPIYWISKSWPTPDLWIAILQKLEPSPYHAHICVAQILKLAFAEKNVENSWPNWTDLHSLDSANKEIFYQERYSVFSYIKGKALHEEKQRRALQAIVDCEPFWEIPTNLFSFFYGLPDDREELRKLLEGK